MDKKKSEFEILQNCGNMLVGSLSLKYPELKKRERNKERERKETEKVKYKE